MLQKTKDYDSFIFRKDNREKIDEAHVQRITESIRSRNLLEFRPVVVNQKMEVIDGQHRILAAKSLNVEIYYQIEKSLDATDIVKMNISKTWTNADYLNFYCHHKYEEYLKLKQFIKKNEITLKIGMSIAMGIVRQSRHDFRMGLFKFKEETLENEINICWKTIDYIKKLNGFSPYTNSSRFWNALLKLIRYPNFDSEKWKFNLERLVDNFCPKPSEKLYVKMVAKIYNWKNSSPIRLGEED
jgi:hypothetical protein